MQLCTAASEGDLQHLETCLAARANPSALVPRRSALHIAAEGGHAACLQRLLEAGGNANIAMDESALTPLHWACWRGHVACVEALLAAGAAVEARCSIGITPLYFAASEGAAACVQALLAAGASPSAKFESGWTPVHIAYMDASVLRLLLAAQPEAAALKTSDGNTPLALALEARRFHSALCPLAEGALEPAHVDDVLAIMGQHAACWVQPLYATLAARQALLPAQWGRVPAPCAGLVAALPVVLERSVEEAAMLVRHLPPADREQLQTAALCLARSQRVHRVHLPSSIVWHLLAHSAAD